MTAPPRRLRLSKRSGQDWFEEWKALNPGLSNRYNFRPVRVRSEMHALQSACADGVVSRISETALEVRWFEPRDTSYLLWLIVLCSTPFIVVPQFLPANLSPLAIISVYAIGLAAVWTALRSLWIVLKSWLWPTPPDSVLLFNRHSQQLHWRDGHKEFSTPWSMVRALKWQTPAGPEEISLLMLNEEGLLELQTGHNGTLVPRQILLRPWCDGRHHAASHDGRSGAAPALFAYVCAFMRHGPEVLPAITWSTPEPDRERLFLDFFGALDYLSSPHNRWCRAIVMLLLTIAAPLGLPAQWLYGLSEVRRQHPEWSVSALQMANVGEGESPSCLTHPEGSQPTSVRLNKAQRVIGWIWIGTAVTAYVMIALALLA